MSTKIYNAYRFKKPQSELIPFLLEVRRNVTQKTIDFFSRLTRYLYLRGFPKLKKVKLLDRFNHGYKTRIGDYDLDSSVSVYFYDGQIYLQFFLPGCFGSYTKAVYKILDQWDGEWMEDFHYQNQSDKPDHITESEWDHRMHTWNEIMENDPHLGRPIYAGLSWQIISGDDFFMFVDELYSQHSMVNK